MSGHFTKRADASLSQSLPSKRSKVAPDATLADTYVGLCDWHGRVVWKSGTGDRLHIGDDVWKNAAARAKECMKSAVASVVTLRENCTLEVEDDRGDHFRLWMWPLSDPEIAVCVLAKPIPRELVLLTERESACLECLAQGKSTRDIAKELDIGLTTVHTHLRRSREKLGLTTSEALIGFAARHFYSPPPSELGEPDIVRKRSG